MFQKISNYLGEVKQELSKVSWPTREEIYGSTGVVLALCIMISLFVFGVDRILSLILEFIFKRIG